MKDDFKIKHDCQLGGCFNEKYRLKFDVFKDCLPRNISFSDIDGIVEVGGRFLTQEWKSSPDIHPWSMNGQLIMAKRLTRVCPAIQSLFVCGNAKNMLCSSLMVINKGVASEWEPCSIDQLKERIKAWAMRADRGPQ